MRRAAFLLLLLLLFVTDQASSQTVCSYQDVLDHLNLTADNSVFKTTRPVLDHTHPTMVELDVLLYAILAVIEKTQTFIPFIWVTMTWNNERIWWNPEDFCGITQISVPKDMLWRPDLFIYEMIQKDESPQNPYMYVSHRGVVSSEEDVKVVSTCQMDVYRFPFDTQSCNISIGSAIHCVEEVRVLPSSNSSRATQFSREVMKTQGDWEFLHLSVASFNFSFEGKHWEQLIYTFTMKRRPLLHVINFLLPILFFLLLDIASFFISDHRGEKLGFKVTVLLAISVLLLILNDILPSMSNKTPVIATYCIVIFALMLLSLLETILVTYLMEKSTASQRKQRGHSEDKDTMRDETTDDMKTATCSCICRAGGDRTGQDLLPALQEVNRAFRCEGTHVLLLILEQLKDLENMVVVHLEDGGGSGRSSAWASRINTAFFIFYIVVVSLFLPLMYNEWKG